MQAVLCYVDNNWAYFTTQPLSKQWGDDWDDAPYEHNAGEPYEPRDNEQWEILKVAWDGDFNTPDYGHCNSPYSVQMINKGAVAWLINDYKAVVVPAGVTLQRFTELINSGGGNVYTCTPKGGK